MLAVPLAATIQAQEGPSSSLDNTSAFAFTPGGDLGLPTNESEIGTHACPDFRLITGGGSETLGTWTTPAVQSNLTVAGPVQVRLYARGTGSAVSFTATLSVAGTEVSAGASNAQTMQGGGASFSMTLDLPWTNLTVGDAIAVTITFDAAMSRGVELVFGDPSNPSDVSLATGDIYIVLTKEKGDLKATVQSPWGPGAIASAIANVKGQGSVSPAETQQEAGSTIFIWHIEAGGDITVTVTDVFGNTYSALTSSALVREMSGIELGGGSLFYLGIVLLGVMVTGYLGGITPLHSFWDEKNMRYLLAFSAGIFISVALFHTAPESIVMSGWMAVVFMALGFAALYVVEHYVIQIIDNRFKKGQDHEHHHHKDGITLHIHDHHSGDHKIEYEDDVDLSDPVCTHHLHSTSEAAFSGVAFHNLIEGIVVTTLFLNPETQSISLVVLLAIILHKAPCTLSISSLLKMGGHSERTIKKGIIVLLSMTPLGAILAISMFIGVEKSLIGLALAFSTGTFLEIGVLDLLPESLAQKKGRALALTAIAAGMMLLWVFSLAE